MSNGNNFVLSILELCMHACVFEHACTHAYMHVQMHAHISVCVHACVCLNMHDISMITSNVVLQYRFAVKIWKTFSPEMVYPKGRLI